MERLVINGGKKLKGKLAVPTAKNAVLPIIAASIMLDGESHINACPKLSDIKVSCEIIEQTGSTAVMQNGRLSVFYNESERCEIPENLCSAMRSSILYLAPLLYRKGKAVLSLPGGCNIGARPVDIHLEGLEQMGAEINCENDKLVVTAPQGLNGTNFKLRLPSVGATETLIMAAVTANGLTILKNCAREPEIVDLARFLNLAGAKITGAGKGEIIIQGVQSLNAVEYTPIPDRIFAATVLSAVNACKGLCVLTNYPQEYMEEFERLLAQTGLSVIHYVDNALVFKYSEKPADIMAHTGYYPAFSTDMGPLLASSMVNNEGSLNLYESIFEKRFSYMPEFRKLGLFCIENGREYYQKNKDSITAAQLAAKDLRAGAALVVAALAKNGSYTVSGVEFIDRGYEDIEKTFSLLGADIRRISVETEKNVTTE